MKGGQVNNTRNLWAPEEKVTHVTLNKYNQSEIDSKYSKLRQSYSIRKEKSVKEINLYKKQKKKIQVT